MTRGPWARLLCLAGVLLVSAACGPALRGGAKGVSFSGTPSPGQKEASYSSRPDYSVPPPSGWGEPLALAGEPGRAGVWFLDCKTGCEGGAALFHYDPGSKKMTRYGLGPGIIAGLNQALVVADSGTVWLGNNETLIRLDPRTAALKRFSIPIPADNAEEEPYLPPEVRKLHQVDSMALAPDGKLAIAMQYAQSISIFDPKTETFSVLQVPSYAAAEDVAYLSDGTLGIGLASWAPPPGSDKVYIVPPKGAPFVVSAASAALLSDGDQFVGFNTGSTAVSLISASGAVRTLPVGATLDVGMTGDAIGPGGQLVEGPTVIDLHTGQLRAVIQTPFWPCQPWGAPPGPANQTVPSTQAPTTSQSPPSTATHMCGDFIGPVAVDGAGTLWFGANSPDPGRALGQVHADDY